MIKKLASVLMLTLIAIGLTACRGQDEKPQDTTADETPIVEETPNVDATDDEDDDVPVLGINGVHGLDDTSVTVGAYFHPLQDVTITNQDGEDITHLLTVYGHVHYGRVGTYTLRYTMIYGDDDIDLTREVEVVSGTIMRESHDFESALGEIVFLGEGSYRTGGDASIVHPVNPNYIAPHLRDRAIPSNGWWTTMLVQNYGAGNGIYTNPFRTSFSHQGVEITNPGRGFVQYWNPEGYNTMAKFSLALEDLHVKTTGLNHDYHTEVIDYSDTSVQVAMRNAGSLVDQMVVTMAQGSPFVFIDVAESSSPYIRLASNGVANYEFFTVSGHLITGSSYTGNGIIIKLVQKHVGYQTARPAHVGQPTYDDRYFLISTPENTTFTFTNDGHPYGLNNRIDMDLDADNYFSIGIIGGVSEGEYYHQHAYNKPLRGDVSFTIDYADSLVHTTYRTAYQSLNGEEEALLQFLMPHHYHTSNVELTDYYTRTVRGALKLFEGNSFTTTHGFHGVIPAMPHPNTSDFNEASMTTYLEDLKTRTEINDPDNFLNDEGPYWNSKAIYPLAQAIIIADQLGDDTLRDVFIDRLKHVLIDWFTIESSLDERYLFYNQNWGAVYYSNNDFNTASELSDHSFTHGYLIYASSVLAMYDEAFVADYGEMVNLLLSGYMHPEKDSEDFAYLRSFDPWAGHTWAHGFGTFVEGNNLESSSEAIQSWVGGYLWALAIDDQALKDAAIYGFVHELNHAKTYMFDYHQEIFPEAYSQYAQVAGMVWGGKYDYATWFGANPTFIYGIQWLPNGEYLSSYALNDAEYNRLSNIYEAYLYAKNHDIDTWFANMWSMQALLDPAVALNQFDASLILNDDYPSDLSQTYYLLHGLNAYGRRTTDYTMEIHAVVASSIYINSDGVINALVWNPSAEAQTVRFLTPDSTWIEVKIEGQRLESIQLSE